jgi:hypothetical protein
MNKITIEEYNKNDYCLPHPFSEELLLDTIEEWLEAYDDLDDITEEDIEMVSEVAVYTRDYFKLNYHYLWEWINDYAEDNFGLITCGHEVQGDDIVKDFVEAFNKKQYFYTTDKKVGVIDLTERLREYVNKER